MVMMLIAQIILQHGNVILPIFNCGFGMKELCVIITHFNSFDSGSLLPIDFLARTELDKGIFIISLPLSYGFKVLVFLYGIPQ